MASGASRWVSGAFVGTGSALQIKSVGFRPKQVKLFNKDGLALAEWFDPMPADSMWKQVTAGTLSFVSSDGIQQLVDGFELGADADLNVADEVVYYYCQD